jgi:hypothetical protein
VEELHKQASNANIAFEILCFDDASTLYKEENRKIDFLDNCRYVELPENIGRAKIRNLLADKAQYENLLFLDCDVEIYSSKFIKNYLGNIDKADFISGKHIYSTSPPEDKLYYFHWYYGTRRESKSLNFMSCNFILKKKLWQQAKFNEKIITYGQEDTLFQIDLEKIGIELFFIDNPVVHIGLNSAENFVAKNNESIENMLLISKLLPENKLSRFRLLTTYNKVKRYRLHKIFVIAFPVVKKLLLRNFFSRKPNLFLFDIYKLMYISYVQNK